MARERGFSGDSRLDQERERTLVAVSGKIAKSGRFPEKTDQAPEI